MDLHLQNKIMVITNGNELISKAIAKLLAEENAIPVLIPNSVNKTEECKQVVEKIGKKYNRIDGLIHCAPPQIPVHLEEGNSADFLASLEKTLIQYFLITKYAVPFLIKTKGAIVNVGSKTMNIDNHTSSAWEAGSSGIKALTREWAVDLLKYGIRVNQVEFTESLKENHTSQETNLLAQKQGEQIQKEAANKSLTAQEVGKIVLFLLSDRSSHTTGQIIHADNGSISY